MGQTLKTAGAYSIEGWAHHLTSNLRANAAYDSALRSRAALRAPRNRRRLRGAVALRDVF